MHGHINVWDYGWGFFKTAQDVLKASLQPTEENK